MLTNLTILPFRNGVPNTPKNVDVFLPYLKQYMEEYKINTFNRVVHFLSQIGHESLSFRYVREIWGPTAQQRLYERDFNAPWRNGPGQRNRVAFNLGNTQQGDGKWFMGRGLIQITGRTNYRATSIALFGDTRLLANPRTLEVPEYAVKSACWWWANRGLNELCDKGVDKETCEMVTRKINGGRNGIDDRFTRLQLAIRNLQPIFT